MSHTTGSHHQIVITDRTDDPLTVERNGSGLLFIAKQKGAIARVQVVQQDLTALRDFILALPDEAFPQIPDPLIGALVRINGGQYVGARFRGLYARVVESSSHHNYTLDFGPAADEIGDGGLWSAESFTVIKAADR